MNPPNLGAQAAPRPPARSPRPSPANSLLIALVAFDCLLALLALGSVDSPRLFIFSQLGFLGLLACPLAALWLALKNPLSPPMSARNLALIAALLILLSLALDLSRPRLITDALSILHRRFQAPYWQTFGLLLAGLVFLPLIYQALRRCLSEGRYADLAVAAGFLLSVGLLYLPLGLDNIAHWESWIYLSHLEGRFSWSVAYELTTRFWVALPHALAAAISPDSFAGFHLTHIAIVWAKLVALYAILRSLNIARLYAFLTTTLFMFYPVNSDLLSLRSLPNQFSAMSLLAAGALLLAYREQPSRLRLFGIWLALSFNLASNETAFALILVMPLLWLRSIPSPSSRAWRLTAICYIVPGAKLAHLALLAGHDIRFYNSYVFTGEWNPSADTLPSVVSRLADVFRHTFLDSWLAALRQFPNSDWLSMTAILLAVTALIAWRLARNSGRQTRLSESALARSLAAGLLLLVPSVGILIWLEQYSGDLWRAYFYAPIGAAIAVFSLVALATSSIKRFPIRNAVIIALCLAACAPGINRLYQQRARLAASADNKAALLHNLLLAAPQIKPEAIILLLTDLTAAELDSTDYYEFRYSAELDDSIFYVLYNDGLARPAHFCLAADPCPHLQQVTDPAAPAWNSDIFQRTLFLKLQQDRTVAVIQDPAAYFDIATDIPYDASRLYDPAAPLPPRAGTMLAPALNS